MALTKYVNVYKCRLCGEIYTPSGTNSEIAAWKGTLHEIMRASGLDTPCSTPEVTPTMFEMHCCKDGNYCAAFYKITATSKDQAFEHGKETFIRGFANCGVTAEDFDAGYDIGVTKGEKIE